MYHRIVSAECPVPGEDAEEARYAVDLEEFRWQLDRISAAGRRGVSMAAVLDSLESEGAVPPDWVAVTFDDGNRSDFVHALPLLAEHGFSATFFVGSERIGADGGLDPGMLSAMAASGMEIGSHGVTHRFLTTLTAEEEEEELALSRQALEAVAGVEIKTYAPPGGRIGARGIAALKRLSYRAVCTSEFGLNPCRGKRFEFCRVPVTAETGHDRFGASVDASIGRLLPAYARDRVLKLARRVLGESGYRRVRKLGLGS
jgi:peptidoglycan/xylan/chitin deacetylase (PgdA/CDA1 family)